MTNDNNSGGIPAQEFSAIGANGMSELNDRDFAYVLLPDLDYEAQLLAVCSLIQGHKDLAKGLSDEIRQIEQHARLTKGPLNDHIVDEWVDHIHESVYQDAAHSMAAVGMLAPLIESIFYHAYQDARRHISVVVRPKRDHQRWQQPAEDQWDCHYVWKNGRRSNNLVEGIFQLAEAIGLSPYLPNDLKITLQALFEYRNKMFHCGFEWPIEERQRFAKRIDNSGWPADWFAKATKGGDPWIFYVTEIFTFHCLNLIDSVIEGLGAFAREMIYEEKASGSLGTHLKD